VLFLIGRLTSPAYFDDSEIAVLSLETGKYRVVLEHAATSDGSGYIIYVHSGDLFALPFDPKRLEVTGRALPVVQGVYEVVGNGAAHFALSRNGSLIYSPGGPANENTNLIWLDRKGGEHPIPAPVRPYTVTSLSPDGQHVATGTYSITVGGLGDIAVFDFARNTLTRLTFTGDNDAPLWSPDGKRVAFYSARAQNPGLYWVPAGGSQPAELLTPMTSNGAPTSFSPDGKFLAFVQWGSQTAADIWVLPLQGEKKPRPFAQERFNEGWASFSPDGRWLAYMSDESGQDEIYVRPFPGPGGKWQVSSGGGNYPAWARGGGELFYAHGEILMTVPVETRPTFSAGTPQVLFEKGPLLGSLTAGLGPFLSKPYEVAPDGQRFLVVKHSVSGLTQIIVVLNWFEELKRMAAQGKP
jgi:WD40 repeat protein